VIYLTAEQVIAINASQVGPDALRDRHLLESAVGRPQQSAFGEDAYPDIHTKAAALMHSLAKNHAFVDGNKRTALLAGIGFYGLNGYVFKGSDIDIIHLMVDLATGTIDDIPTIAEYLKKWAEPLPDQE
jgi:death on curing protein